MNDSVDSFMYQKHDEKGTRLDNLWNSKKEKLDINEIDPEALKFSLIKDPKKRADLFIKEKTADLRQREKIAGSAGDKIFKMAGEHKALVSEIKDNQQDLDKMKAALDIFTQKSDVQIIKEYRLNFDAVYGRSINDDYVHVKGATIRDIKVNYVKAIKEQIANTQKTIQQTKGKLETVENTLKRYGVDDVKDMTVDRVRKEYSAEAQRYKKQIEAIENNRKQYIEEASKKIKEETKIGVSVEAAVAKNTEDVSNNLYSMDVVKERVLKERGMKKSLVIWRNRIYIRSRIC
jgi:hypothetical protein